MGIRQNAVRSMKSQSGTFKILFLGRLIKIKGLKYLLKACKDIENVQIFIAGDGPERKKLEAKYPGAVFLGHVSGQQKKALLESSDLAVFPSIPEIWRTEGTPVALLEAMAAGIPVIATSVGGMKEVISHEHNGLLVRERSARAIRESVLRLINNPDERARLSQEARKLSDQFQWNKITERFAHIFGTAMSVRKDWMV